MANVAYCKVCKKVVRVIRPGNSSDMRAWCAEHDPECKEDNMILWKGI